MNEKLSSWLLFFIYPFFSLYVAFKNYTRPYAKNIFWAFCVFYGFTFAIGSENVTSDISRYLEELQYLHTQYFMSISDAIIYFKQSGEIDMLNTAIAFLLSRFTDSLPMLTMIYALIFGFFLSRNIWYVFKFLEGKISLLTKLLLLGLILIIPIWFINGFRMWTAFHVFMYGLLPFIFENKKNNFFFIFLSFLIHFSFAIPITVFFFYWIVGNRINLFFLLFIISSFVSEINVNFFNNYFEIFLPEVVLERTYAYRNEQSVKKVRELREKSTNTVWYLKWKGKLLRWSFYLLIIYFYLFSDPRIKEKFYWKRLFSINLLFFTLANIISNLPSGGRFVNLYLYLSFIMAIMYLNQIKNDYKFRFLIQLLSPAFILFIVVSIRIGFYSTSLTAILGNPFLALLGAGNTISLNDLIK